MGPVNEAVTARLADAHTQIFCLHGYVISVSLVVDEDSHFVNKL